jgi:uncharacterized protein involved in response to NO
VWYGTGLLLLLMAIAQTARLSRWAGALTWREPILFVLHVGYAFVPLGALTIALSIFWPYLMPSSSALRCDGNNDARGDDARDARTHRP